MRAIGALSCLILVASLFEPQLTAADAKRWSKLDTRGTGPSERSRPAVAAVGSKIYVFGGTGIRITS